MESKNDRLHRDPVRRPIPSSSSNEPTETQLAQAGDNVQVAEPALGTTIQLVAAGDSLQLNFDPADVAKVETKDGNLEITFKNGSVAVIQGYEEWAAAGGQPTGPQGGVVDVAQLGQPAAPAVCELPNPNVHVVDVPIPADGERLTLAVAPGDALRLACSFRDVHGTEVGHNLEMSFPGGGVVVVENFSEWIAAKGATISDCVCGGVNPADFIIALGLNPEDVLPGRRRAGPAGPLPDSPFLRARPGPRDPAQLRPPAHPAVRPPSATACQLRRRASSRSRRTSSAISAVRWRRRPIRCGSSKGLGRCRGDSVLHPGRFRQARYG